MRHARTRTLRSTAGLVLALALAAAGCGEAEDGGGVVEEDTPVQQQTTEAAESPAAGAEAGALTADLAPLNGSQASGTATVEMEGNTVTVTVNTQGVSPSLPHAQHIHIGGQNECPPPDASGDDDFISTPEGQPFYGGIEVSLTTEGDVGEQSALAVERFPVASDQGTITYQRSFDLPQGTTQEELNQGVIVQHGIADTTLGTDPSQYDGPPSPLSDAVPQEATLPTLCGSLASQ